MPQPSIEVLDLRYSYGDRVAVDGIGFEVAPGEILGLLGPNGAGKSTTIKLLTGQMPPMGGRARILGLDVQRDTARAQSRIGVVFEEKNLYENMTGAENLAFFARLFGLRDYDTSSALDRVGLDSRGPDRVKSYSKGMRQRLMVARALVNTPDVLFLDEPTDGLDPASAQAIRHLIRSEARRGAAVLLTTHDMHEADSLSDRVAFINDGRIVAMDTPENLKLRHGRRSVRLRVRTGAEVSEVVVPLDDAGANENLRQALAQPGILTAHTEEATLEDVFILVTGRHLT